MDEAKRHQRAILDAGLACYRVGGLLFGPRDQTRAAFEVMAAHGDIMSLAALALV